MKIARLIHQAAHCRNEADAKKLLAVLEAQFWRTRTLKRLAHANAESYMEGLESKGAGRKFDPFVRFELNRVISPEFITMIRPEIREGALSVSVRTNRMLDHMGLGSQRWEEIEDLDDLIEASGRQTVAAIAQQAADIAIRHHASLIEAVGVSSGRAQKIAKQMWTATV